MDIDQPYTGHVSPDSNPQVFETDDARVIKMSVGGFDNNVYLIRDLATGDAVFIDAANEADRIVELIRQEAPNLRLIVTTHRHPDHWQALKEVAAATGVDTAAHPIDGPELPVAPTRLLEDGDVLEVGNLRLPIIHLAGHTPGSIALVLSTGGVDHLFTGDSLFPGGIGKTAGPDEFASLLGDVEAKIFDRYPDSAVVHPGHGDDTTLGRERPALPEWRERGW